MFDDQMAQIIINIRKYAKGSKLVDRRTGSASGRDK
jgi:hypothetical protein